MQLTNRFTVPVQVDEAWGILLDATQLAPCMPGAAVESVQGDQVYGRVKVRLGPISITYKGQLTFTEKDEIHHRVVLDAAGREASGNGTASARVTADLTESGNETLVGVTTDLTITGKPAQFGRGVMADVSERIIQQFAANLARQLDSGPLRPDNGERRSVPPPTPRVSVAPPVEIEGPRSPISRNLLSVLAILASAVGVAIVLRIMNKRTR